MKNREFHKLNLYYDNTQSVFPCLKWTMESITMCKIFSLLTVKTPKRQLWLCFVAKIFNNFWCFHCWLWTSKCRLRKKEGLEICRSNLSVFPSFFFHLVFLYIFAPTFIYIEHECLLSLLLFCFNYFCFLFCVRYSVQTNFNKVL